MRIIAFAKMGTRLEIFKHWIRK